MMHWSDGAMTGFGGGFFGGLLMLTVVALAVVGVDAIEDALHACVTEDSSPTERPHVVDDVEGTGAGIQKCGEGSREPVREPPEGPHQDAQVPDQEVTEEHVEQKLLVRPCGPVG